jgi:hypothetical protein
VECHGSKNRKPPETGREDELGESFGLLPSDVARRVFGTNSGGITDLKDRQASAKAQRQAIVMAGLLPVIPFPRSLDAKGTEHAVRFRGKHVEKHQHSDGWVPVLDPSGMLALNRASPIEYLRRLELQNELFGDHIRIIGLTRADRFAIIQPTLRGGEPKENEIRDILEEGGWQRVPITIQNLPIQLMGSAWWHDEEGLVLLDARKPNFKKTDFGALPIDLILGDLSPEMHDRLISK